MNQHRTFLSGTALIWTGIGAGVLYWILEALVGTIFFAERPFVQELLSPPSHEVWMRSLGVSFLVLLGVVAQLLVSKRQRAEEETQRLNSILRTIRKVNQVLMHAEDRAATLRQVCRTLIEGRGYYSAWVALTDENDNVIHTAQAGRGSRFSLLEAKLGEGWLPNCGKRALSSATAVSIAEPSWNCVECPTSERYAGRSALACRLEHAGRIYGFICASIPKRYASNERERALLTEVADDVAFALHKLAVEEQQEAAEQALRESEERYRTLAANSPDSDLYLYDHDLRFLLADGTEMLKHGFSKDQWEGRTLQEALDEETADLLEPHYRKALQGEPSQVEFTYGDQHYVVKTVPITNEQGDVVAGMAISHNITQRKEAQRAVEESEEKYRSLVENLTVGVYRNTPGPQGEFVEANQAIVSMFGYDDEEEFKNIHVADLYQHPEDRKRFSEKLSRQGYVRNEELKLQKKDGTPFWGSVTAIAVTDENGDVQYYDGIIEDITRRKRAEQKLQESEERYRSIVENAQAGILIVGEDYRFIYVNDRLCEMLGYSEEEILGEDFRTFLDEESKELVADRYKKRQRGEEVPSRYEFNIVRKNGEKRRVEISSTVITDAEGKKKTVAQILDITERKKAKEALQQSEKEKTLILDTSPALIAYQDTSHRVIWANKTAAQSVNETPEDLEGRRCFEIWHQQGQPCENCPVEKAIETGEMQEGEMSTPDGRHWLIRGSPVRDDDGNIIGTVETTLDITERKKAEEEMERALEKERVFKLKTAHHFFNPLAISKGYLDVAMEDLPDGYREPVQKARDALMRIQRVVENIVQRGEIHE